MVELAIHQHKLLECLVDNFSNSNKPRTTTVISNLPSVEPALKDSTFQPMQLDQMQTQPGM